MSCGDEAVSPVLTPLATSEILTSEPVATPTLAAGLPTAPPAPTALAQGITPITPRPLPSPTPPPTPTATPLPARRIELGQAQIDRGDLAAAAQQLEASLEEKRSLNLVQQEDALYALGTAYYYDEEFAAAAAAFNELLALSAGDARSETYFLLGRTYAELGDLVGSVGAYQAYLERNPEMSPYISPFIAEAYLVLGERENAIAAYESALSELTYPPMLFDIRQRLAELYIAGGAFEAAVAQYNVLAAQATSETLQGRMNYLAAEAEILAGNVEEGYRLYLQGINEYPRAYESYLGLVALVDAGIPVDDYQRGLVDYYAGMYDPAIAAFMRHIETSAQDYNGDAHLFLAWSYEGLGDVNASITQLDTYASFEPANAILEKARLLRRDNDLEGSVEAYLQFAASYPEHESASDAAWLAASLTERLRDLETAVDLYRDFAVSFPSHEKVAEALFRVGLLSYELGDPAAALAEWRATAESYPASEYGAASLLWLLKTIPEAPVSDNGQTTGEEAYPAATPFAEGDVGAEKTVDLEEVVTDLITNITSESYYALRAKDIVNDVAPFETVAAFNLSPDEESTQAEAEEWLRGWLELDREKDLRGLSAVLANDPRLIVGEKLWKLGLWEQAKQLLEALRREHAGDALLCYQLALFFRDLGLYRSSILSANSLLSLSGSPLLDAPPFVGRLLYPVHFSELIVALAQRYGFNPLLQFSLVRQESLFESFARSSAAAQGLAQVIPTTGEYIARQLNWPDYENEDLFKPYVGLAFGAYYLNEQLRTFDNHVHVALSAYNAGPGNATRWFDRAGTDYDAYLETVDFAETRLYIERIYVGYVMYRHLYGD